MRTALMALKEARATMDLVGKVTGELIHKQVVDIRAQVQWRFTTGKEEEREAVGAPVVNGHAAGELPPEDGPE